MNVTAPMKTPMYDSMRARVVRAPSSRSYRYFAKPTSTAAAPTKQWSIATNYGIEIIST